MEWWPLEGCPSAEKEVALPGAQNHSLFVLRGFF